MYHFLADKDNGGGPPLIYIIFFVIYALAAVIRRFVKTAGQSREKEKPIKPPGPLERPPGTAFRDVEEDLPGKERSGIVDLLERAFEERKRELAQAQRPDILEMRAESEPRVPPSPTFPSEPQVPKPPTFPPEPRAAEERVKPVPEEPVAAPKSFGKAAVLAEKRMEKRFERQEKRIEQKFDDIAAREVATAKDLGVLDTQLSRKVDESYARPWKTVGAVRIGRRQIRMVPERLKEAIILSEVLRRPRIFERRFSGLR